jgi:hypothetical protein
MSIEQITENALFAFWQSVEKDNPNIKTGDYPIDLTIEQTELSEFYIEQWLQINN